MDLMMKDIPEEDRPYEKCLRLGPEALSDRELLAVFLRTATHRHSALTLADEILRMHLSQDGLTNLMTATLPELQKLEGVGKVKGIQLICLAELCRRLIQRQAVVRNKKFNHADAVAEYYMEKLRYLQQEHIYVMLLNNRNGLIRDVLISKGTVNTSVTSPRDILMQAVRYNAVSIILVHNHPSGDPEPSEADRIMTDKVREAANVMGIPLLDHVIIGDGSYYSFKQDELL